MDDKSLITNNLSSIYKNTFDTYTVQDKEPFKNKAPPSEKMPQVTPI